MMELGIIFGGVFATCVILGFLTVSVLGRQRRVHGRMERIALRSRPLSLEEKTRQHLKRTNAEGLPLFEKMAKHLLPRPAEIRDRLIRTGRKISLGRYFVICVAVGIVAASAVWASQSMPWFVIAAAGIIAGIGLPHMTVGMMISRRRNKFTSLFPDAIDLMVRGLRSGLPVTETIAACGREMVDPIGPEFRRIADSIRLGQSLEDALWEAVKRLDTPEFKFFVISLSVQKETGGNLAETLANLSEILRSRKQMKLKIRAMSSEAKASAMILGSLPFLMFGIIYFLNPEYEAVLFSDIRGRIMLGAALGLMAMGGFVMSKMVRFEI